MGIEVNYGQNGFQSTKIKKVTHDSALDRARVPLVVSSSTNSRRGLCTHRPQAAFAPDARGKLRAFRTESRPPGAPVLRNSNRGCSTRDVPIPTFAKFNP